MELKIDKTNILGNTFKNNKGCEFKVIEVAKFKNRTKYKIKFLDNVGFEKYVILNEIKHKTVSNPYFKSIYGVGFLGEGKYKSYSKEYSVWYSMFCRVYDSTYQKKFPTYKNISICNEWHNFQNFAKWCEDNYPYNIKNIRFELDKDWLQQNIEDKIYSPTTCVFLPQSVNSFLTNIKASNSSNYTGVTWMSKINKWQVTCSIFMESKSKYLGVYSDKYEAYKVYMDFRNKNLETIKQYLKDLNYLDCSFIDSLKLKGCEE